jgi:hypothetical protein
MRASRSLHFTVWSVVVSLALSGGSGPRASANEPPVAEAGLPQYAAAEAVRLDGSGSYDPEGSPLHYTWRQVSGPAVTLTDADSATPWISGPSQKSGRGLTIPGPFAQTEAIQECEFELVVSDGELTSAPDAVKLFIVPAYGASTLSQENPPFDADKPTFIFFGGGNCVTGAGTWNDGNWASRANVISFSTYGPDSGSAAQTYYKYGDMIIVYLSRVAPDYRQLIQTAGWSTGGQPALDAGLRLNLTYKDARFAVNRITFLDATPYCRATPEYAEDIRNFLGSSVDGEQCWIDNHVGQNVSIFFPGVLNVGSALTHGGVPAWVKTSAVAGPADAFNHGLVAGAYWSVIGPGRNLQLAPAPNDTTYVFKWIDSVSPAYMDFFDESSYPGRLPEPVTLGAWVNTDFSGAADGAVLSCHTSENAVGYELLFGSDPYRVMDFHAVSDTPLPPTDIMRDLPAGQVWWTVRVRDRYGSTIHADPVLLDLTGLPPLAVENARTGKRYGLISHALQEAQAGDVILVSPGTHEENIEFTGSALTVQSLDPNDPVTVANTIVRGRDSAPTISFAGPQSAGCVLAGLNIQSQTVSVSCRDAAPTIRNCVVDSPGPAAVHFWIGHEPALVDCTLLGSVKVNDPGLVGYWSLDEAQGTIAHDSAGQADATVQGQPLWQPGEGRIDGALQLDGVGAYLEVPLKVDPARGAFSVFAWVRGGAPGQVILSQQDGSNWLKLAAPDGVLTVESKGARMGPLVSSIVIADGAWHRVGLVWDGGNRILYVDDTEVARDTQNSLGTATAGLYFGAGGQLEPDSFWSGLIDDVRIYDRVMQP